MMTIHLLELPFYAFHGIYPGEAKLGSNYQVDLVVNYDERGIEFDNITNVINYVELYEIIKKRMAIASPLLEEVAEAIIIKIKHQYPTISEIRLSIFKLQPPIEGFEGKLGITLQKQFET